MFFVYSGYTTCDSDLDNINHTISEYQTKEEVLIAKKEFEEQVAFYESHDGVDNKVFRVFEGEEKTLKGKKVITEWTF